MAQLRDMLKKIGQNTYFGDAVMDLADERFRHVLNTCSEECLARVDEWVATMIASGLTAWNREAAFMKKYTKDAQQWEAQWQQQQQQQQQPEESQAQEEVNLEEAEGPPPPTFQQIAEKAT